MGKEKKQYPKITKKLLDFLDEKERNREPTFQSFDVFGRTYTESSVKGTIKNDLKRIPLLKKRYTYLFEAKTFINQMDPKTHLKEELDITETIRLGMVYAYYPLKVWIEKQYDQIEKEIEKEKSNKEKKKQLDDSQTTFEINKKYSNLLHDMWELMKGDKIHLIHQDTTLENFKIIFTKKRRVEVKKPIVWLGNKKTLLKLFCSLSDKKIITPTALSWDKDNPLDITFINQENMNPYFLWRDTHSKLSNTTLREQDKIDKILLLFQ